MGPVTHVNVAAADDANNDDATAIHSVAAASASAGANTGAAIAA